MNARKTSASGMFAERAKPRKKRLRITLMLLYKSIRVGTTGFARGLHGVAVKALVQAVKRNKERFPDDFCFQLTWNEAKILNPPLEGATAKKSRSHFVTLKQGKNVKYLPYAFTEQGVAMLSSILRSKRAVRVNIAIMRAFVQLR